MSAPPSTPQAATWAGRFGEAFGRLRRAQKAARKASPLYSLFVNRPMGRVLAAAAYTLGASPNQVTYVSAAFTFTGLGILALAAPTWFVGAIVALCLILGYAFDSADGQLARLSGVSSLTGEWLDHTVDSVKVITVHVAVLICWYRFFGLDPAWLLVPLGFAVVAAVHFFGMILVDLLGRIERRSRGGPEPAAQALDPLQAILKLPTDYGVLCLLFVVLGAQQVFVVGYTALAVATAGYTVLVVGKWRRDVRALDLAMNQEIRGGPARQSRDADPRPRRA